RHARPPTSFPTRRSSDLPYFPATVWTAACTSASATVPPPSPSLKTLIFDEAHSAISSIVFFTRLVLRSATMPPSGSSLSTLLARSEEHTSELQSRFDLVC